ncbi:hypothetical protein SAMN05216233_101117 [Desulfoluna spongiiphila]|uniref:ABC-type transport auxiliary lipoprotein component domain-containing protein n=1 Tax=Desulfoluna spongiiphila TaxID=419481 RepID=A0A1G5AEW5_9BACT|nr:hypothetical protein SAMN05216233_101117 [Desulfoluna spongiiphila]
MKKTYRKTPCFSVVCFMLLLAGCATPPTEVTYHLLHTREAFSEKAVSWPPSLYVVVGPVSVPDYLKRPQMVVRNTDHTLSFLENVRWAEPVDRGIARAVSENVSHLSGNQQVALFPFDVPKGATPIQVSLDIVRFDAGNTTGAVLDARWVVTNRVTQAVAIGHTKLRGVAEDKGALHRVAALDVLVASLSGEVARAIESVK